MPSIVEVGICNNSQLNILVVTGQHPMGIWAPTYNWLTWGPQPSQRCQRFNDCARSTLTFWDRDPKAESPCSVLAKELRGPHGINTFARSAELRLGGIFGGFFLFGVGKPQKTIPPVGVAINCLLLFI